MRRTGKLCLLVLIFCAGAWTTPKRACAQSNNSDLPDSPFVVARSEHGNDPPAEREVSRRSLPGDFLHDQKDIWLFPGQLAKGRHWLPTLAITGVTAGLIVADPHVMPYFRSHAGRLDDLNDTFDAPITTVEVIALPASLMVAGYYVRHDQYGQRFPVRARSRCFFCRHGHCHPLSQTPLGAMGNVRFRTNRYQLFSSKHERSFSVGCVSWSGSRVHHYAV